MLSRAPCGRLRRGRHAHVVLGIDPEVVFTPLHDIAGGELVIEEPVRNYVPGPFGGVALGHHVVQPVVPLLVRGGLPDHSHCARHILLQLDRARWLWLI